MGVAALAPHAVVESRTVHPVADLERSLAFYKTLGFNVVERYEPTARP